MNNKNNELYVKVFDIQERFRECYYGCSTLSFQKLILTSKNLDYIFYNYLHRKAFSLFEKKLRERGVLQYVKKGCYKYHDLDKMVLYLFIESPIDVYNLHRAYSMHHQKITSETDKIYLIESIIDWECAHITKVDKPLSAIETVDKFYPSSKEFTYPIIQKLDLCKNVNFPKLTMESYELMVKLVSIDDLIADYKEADTAFEIIKNNLITNLI